MREEQVKTFKTVSLKDTWQQEELLAKTFQHLKKWLILL
jgi:hypothetical protein